MATAVVGALLLVGFTMLTAGCQRKALSDGLTDTQDCSACHGSAANAAPPKSVDGSSRTKDIAVGAHQAHLVAGKVSGPVECSECHVVPTSLAAHPSIDGGPATVAFGVRATLGSATPTWDRVTARCQNGYCHGANLSGAETREAPVWTRVDGAFTSCTSCHGNPPGGTHPANPRCESCHGDVVGPGGVILAKERHIDGVIDVSGGGTHPVGYAAPALHGADTKLGASNCLACHGSDLTGHGSTIGCDSCHQQGWRTNCTYCHGGVDNATGAPPVDLRDQSDSTVLGVGSHTRHVTRSHHAAYACTTCHSAVTDVLTPGHVFDRTPGVSEVVLTQAPKGAGQYASPGCTDVYCHGNGITNGSVANFAASAPLSCQGCHPQETQSSSHAFHRAYGCQTCHQDVVSDASTVINPELHIDGSIEVRMAAGSWDALSRTCSGTACHGAEAISW